MPLPRPQDSPPPASRLPPPASRLGLAPRAASRLGPRLGPAPRLRLAPGRVRRVRPRLMGRPAADSEWAIGRAGAVSKAVRVCRDRGRTRLWLGERARSASEDRVGLSNRDSTRVRHPRIPRPSHVRCHTTSAADQTSASASRNSRSLQSCPRWLSARAAPGESSSTPAGADPLTSPDSPTIARARIRIHASIRSRSNRASRAYTWVNARTCACAALRPSGIALSGGPSKNANTSAWGSPT